MKLFYTQAAAFSELANFNDEKLDDSKRTGKVLSKKFLLYSSPLEKFDVFVVAKYKPVEIAIQGREVGRARFWVHVDYIEQTTKFLHNELNKEQESQLPHLNPNRP